MPAGPAGPSAPAGPAIAAPVAPLAPVAPCSPVAPVAPAGPAGPTQLTGESLSTRVVPQATANVATIASNSGLFMFFNGIECFMTVPLFNLANGKIAYRTDRKAAYVHRVPSHRNRMYAVRLTPRYTRNGETFPFASALSIGRRTCPTLSSHSRTTGPAAQAPCVSSTDTLRAPIRATAAGRVRSRRTSRASASPAV